MNTDVEQLVHEGLDRFAAAARVPAGLAGRARRRCRRRRIAAGSAIASGTAAVTAVAVVAATGLGGQAGSGVVQARTAAYVVLRHVQRAVAQEHLVMFGRSVSRMDTYSSRQTSAIWSYRSASRFEEFWRGKPASADGTAEIHGRLREVYVTYGNRRWSGGDRPMPPPPRACTKTASLELGGPAPASENWPSFVGTMLGCGAATVTGREWIDGVHTIKITGTPVQTRLPYGMTQANRARVRFTLYVNPRTYLPVRLDGSTTSFGGGTPPSTFTTVTNIRWLPPTAANVARTIVTIPPGFRHVKSPSGQ